MPGYADGLQSVNLCKFSLTEIFRKWVIPVSLSNTDFCSMDSMLLTIIFPRTDSQPSQFCAAMLSFPQGNAELVLHHLQDKSVLRELIQCLAGDEEGLYVLSDKLAQKGCPQLEIRPVDKIGYYDLGVITPRLKPRA